MAKFVVLGLEGETGLWLVDFAHGTVASLDASQIDAAGAAEAGFLAVANHARASGFSLTMGVNLAVATDSRSDASAQKMSP